MARTLIALCILCTQLSACVVPPSRSYDANTASNFAVLDEHALNIDAIEPARFEVAANKTWQNSGVFLENGDTVNITAHGSWSPAPQLAAWSGPEGNILWSVEVPGIPGGALMAKIGHDGKAFLIGTSKTFRSKDYGMLYLAMNDSFSYLFDNTGAVQAEIYSSGSGDAPGANGSGKLDIVSYQYSDKDGSGSLSARINGDHFSTRQRMVAKIGEIASSKNIAIRAGKEKLDGGNYELRDESTRDGILTINFKALW